MSRRAKLESPTLSISENEYLLRAEVPTPPYRRDPSSSHLPLHQHPLSADDSPAYESTLDLTNMNDKKDSYDVDEKPKPVVHYPDSISVRHSRNNSTDPLSSRPASLAGTDDEFEDESDYDWSGDDDLVDEEAKFEKQMGVRQQRKGCGFKRILTLLFSTLLGSTLLAGVLVTPALLVHFYWYKPHPDQHRLYVKQNVQAWLFWAASNLLISWYLAMIVDLVPIVCTFIISLAWGHVSEYVKNRIEMYDSIKHTIKPVLYAASAWISWDIIFGHIFDLYNTQDASASRASYTPRLSQVVIFFFFLTLVVCLQRMLSHFVAFAFHATAFKDRIQSVQEALIVIEKLRQYKPKIRASGYRTPGLGSPFTSDKDHFNFFSSALRVPKSKQRVNYDGEDADTEDVSHESRGRRKNAKGKSKSRPTSQILDAATPVEEGTSGVSTGLVTPSTTTAMLARNDSPHKYPPSRPATPDNTHDPDATLVQAAKVLKNAVLHDARGIQGKDDAAPGMAWNVNTAQEAKRLARSLWMHFRDRGRHYLVPSDFYPAYGGDKAAAEAAFRVFDKDNNGDVSRAEIKTVLMRVYKERRFLSRSMRDVGVALKTLDYILLFFALVVLFFISLSIFGVDVTKSLTSLYTLGIAASFVFKNACTQAFEAIMFLFVTHPYDTGDRCFIDGKYENFVVKKMTLFATVFTRSDGTETYYFNSQLFTKFITNVRRSDKMVESVTMQMAWRTPTEKIDELQKLLNEWLSTEENRWYQPNTSISFQNISYQRYLEVTIGIGHNSNWQDWGARNARRTAFHAAVKYYCEQLGITLYETPRPIKYVDQGYSPNGMSMNDAMPSPSMSRPDLMEMDSGDMTMIATKTNLGFRPPAAERETMLKARKSRGKKAAMRGVGADG